MHCATRFLVDESSPADFIDPVLDTSTTIYYPYLQPLVNPVAR